MPAPGDIGCSSKWHCCYIECKVGQTQTKGWGAGWTEENGTHLAEEPSRRHYIRDLKQRRRRQGRRLEKINLYFTVESRRWLDLFSASIGLRTCPSLICNASVQFQTKIRKISRCRLRSPKYPELGHFTLLFCRGRLRNVQRIITHVHSYCSSH